MFFVLNQSLGTIYPDEENAFIVPNQKKKIILGIHVSKNRPTNINSKNGGKRCFSLEIKASITFIPMRRMNLWPPIIKRNEIVM